VLPTVYIVFSRRPQVVTKELYDRWYEAHISQVLGVPGFAVAARYDLVPALDEPAEPDRYTSAAIYEIELSAPEAMAALAAELSSGRMDLPDWFGEIRFSSWLADPLGQRIELGGNEGNTLAQSLQVVFSDAGDAERPVSDPSFDGWYEQHLGEILSIPGFTSAQRYKLEEVTKPEGGTIPGRRLCIYTTSKPPAELRAEMERMNLLSADSYEKLKDTDSSGPALPQWWESVRFASWNLIPIGERIEAPAEEQ
jgi:hypothetical protein